MNKKGVVVTDTIELELNRPNNQALGAWLKQERLNQKISLADMAAQLYLREEKVQELEENEHTTLDAYLRGYIRGYARFLKISPEVINQKLSEMPCEAVQQDSPMRVDLMEYGVDWSRLMKHPYFLAGIAVFVLVVVTLLWHHEKRYDTTQKQIQAMVTVVNQNDSSGEPDADMSGEANTSDQQPGHVEGTS